MVAIIDTHHHLWDLERLELPWVSSIPQLNRSFRMPDYLTAVHDQAIAATVYMEVNVVEAQHQHRSRWRRGRLQETAASPTSA